MLAVSTTSRTNVILFPRNNLYRGENAMQVDCKECGGNAIIQSRKKLDIKMSQLYCSCKDPSCGHTFVMDLSFSHTLSPSGKQAQGMIIDFLRALPEQERQLMFASL
jgi:hypothetical protein